LHESTEPNAGSSAKDSVARRSRHPSATIVLGGSTVVNSLRQARFTRCQLNRARTLVPDALGDGQAVRDAGRNVFLDKMRLVPERERSITEK
jgi:hypothetical protein